MIEYIEIKNVATYDNIGTSITNLKKINFIYGANGSGKTTVSNFLTNITDGKFQDSNLRWKNEQFLNTLVYNKEFRDKNFGINAIKGVFTLGEATEENIKVINDKQDELKVIKEDGVKKKEALEKLQTAKDIEENSFKEDSWKKVYKKNELHFKEAFKGFMYKHTFRDKLFLEYQENNSTILEFDELKEKSKIIFGEVPHNLDLISYNNYEEIKSIEKNNIWDRKIIGKADIGIAKLIQKLNLNDWVSHGKSYIQDDDICPFCQEKTITDDFRKQLESYFDITFIESIEKVKQLKYKYILEFENLLNELNQIEITHKNDSKTKLDIDRFSAYLKILFSQFNSNRELLGNKLKEPSRSMELVSTEEQLANIKTLINNANEEINKHNNIVDNYQIERNSLVNVIWKFISNSYSDEIKSYVKKVNGLRIGIDNLSNEHKLKQDEWIELNKEIKELTKNVTSIQPTIDEINKILKNYGFLNFEILPSKIDSNQYQIKREDGSLAESTLSEGEITFITFLYYYQLTKGAINKDEVSSDRVLVIDDPISSLDSNILFVVSTLIKEIIENIKNDKGNIKQLILLTHNVYFHKEVSFIDGRNNGDKNTHYWILRKNNKVSTFYSYGIKNPIQTSYQLLWQELKDKEKNSMITIQNTMRRIIENYFKILGNYKDNSLITKFQIKEEQIICKSLISWINDGSHSISDDLYIELPDDSIDKYLEVFKKIFKLTNHEGHYNMMMNIEN